MKYKKILSTLLLAAMVVGLAMPLSATSHHRSSRSSSTTRSHKKNNRPKTVHVRSYKRKDGTVVKAHDRASPEPRH